MISQQYQFYDLVSWTSEMLTYQIQEEFMGANLKNAYRGVADKLLYEYIESKFRYSY